MLQKEEDEEEQEEKEVAHELGALDAFASEVDGIAVLADGVLVSKALGSGRLKAMLKRGSDAPKLANVDLMRSCLDHADTAALVRLIKSRSGIFRKEGLRLDLTETTLEPTDGFAKVLEAAHVSKEVTALNLQGSFGRAGRSPWRVLHGLADFRLLSEGRLEVVAFRSNTTVAMRNMPPFRTGSGCFYYEVELVQVDDVHIGFSDATTLFTTFSKTTGTGDSPYSWALDPFEEKKIENGSVTSFGGKCELGDVIGVFVDVDNKKMMYSRNGSFDEPFGKAFTGFSLWKGILPSITLSSNKFWASSVIVNTGPGFTYGPPEDAAPVSQWITRQVSQRFSTVFNQIRRRKCNESILKLNISSNAAAVKVLGKEFADLQNVFAGVFSLDISENSVGDKRMALLADWHGLQVLKARNNKIANCPELASEILDGHCTFQVLDLSHNRLGSGILPATLAGPHSILKELNLSFNGIDSGEVFDAVAENRTITVLSLAGNRFDSKILKDNVCPMIGSNDRLKSLDLSLNMFRTGWAHLEKALAKNGILTSLDLSGNDLCREALEAKALELFDRGRIGVLVALGLNVAAREKGTLPALGAERNGKTSVSAFLGSVQDAEQIGALSSIAQLHVTVSSKLAQRFLKVPNGLKVLKVDFDDDSVFLEKAAMENFTKLASLEQFHVSRCKTSNEVMAILLDLCFNAQAVSLPAGVAFSANILRRIAMLKWKEIVLTPNEGNYKLTETLIRKMLGFPGPKRLEALSRCVFEGSQLSTTGLKLAEDDLTLLGSLMVQFHSASDIKARRLCYLGARSFSLAFPEKLLVMQLDIQDWQGPLDLSACSANSRLSLTNVETAKVTWPKEPCLSVVIKHCPRVNSLPKTIQGMLRLVNVPSIVKLQGHSLAILELRRCDKIADLKSLHVRENLSVHDCKRLRTLPKTSRTLARFSMMNCPCITSVHGIQATERFEVFDSEIEAIESLSCDVLSLARCPRLRELPAGLVVQESLRLHMCLSLSFLPAIKVYSLRLSELSSLEEIGDGFLARDLLEICNCPSLVRVPASMLTPKTEALLENSRVQMRGSEVNARSFKCVSCDDITMPKQIRATREVCFDRCGMVGLGEIQCMKFTLTNCLNVTEVCAIECKSIEISGCASFERLPRLSVVGTIHLQNLNSLQHPPSSISARRLYIIGCANLLDLSAELSVEEMALTDDTSLTEIPPNARIRRVLELRNCSALTTISSKTLKRLPRLHVDQNSAISRGLEYEALEERCRIANTMLHLSEPEEVFDLSLTPRTLNEACALWEEEAGIRHTLELESEIDPFYHDVVLKFLKMLLQSAMYRRKGLRKGFARQVVEILDILQKNSDGAREELIVRVADSIDACADKPLVLVNDMFLLTKIMKARGDRGKLRNLGLRVMRLELVRELARQHPEFEIDDVCVMLRYEISLREPLDLPVSSQAMLYRDYIVVTEDQLKEAKRKAESITQDEFEAWLPTWTEWKRQERLELSERVDWLSLPSKKLDRHSSLRAFSGEPMDRPVFVSGKRGPWDLDELLEFYVRTGMDFTNTQIPPETFISALTRVEFN